MKKLSLLLLSAVLFTFSILFAVGQVNSMEIPIDNIVRLCNNSNGSQTIQVYTRMKGVAGVKYKEKQTLCIGEYVELNFSPDEEVLFRIRTYTKDCQFVFRMNQWNEIYVRDILHHAVDRIWHPFEKMVPYVWEQEEKDAQEIQQDSQQVV